MNLYNIVLNIKNKDDFVKFVGELNDDLKNNPLTWENTELTSYLEAIQSWVTDMDGWGKNLNIDIKNISVWQLMAHILFASKIYE